MANSEKQYCDNCDHEVQRLPKAGGRIEVKHLHFPVQGFDPSNEVVVYRRVVTQEQHDAIVEKLAQIEERLAKLEERGSYVRKHSTSEDIW